MQDLETLVSREPMPEPWSEGDNIPWNDPEFSRRMLREHLTQDHGGASRRSQTIEAQVAWISRELGHEPTRILDLGCGPGLYTQQLASLGHTCVGIDYSPASITYARRKATESGAACTYHCQDIRAAEFGTEHGLVTLLYGEINVFRPADVRRLLIKAFDALEPGGMLLLEPSTCAAVEAFGRETRRWSSHQAGLFSDAPHLYMTESHWDEGHRTSTRRYFVLDAHTSSVTRYCQTLKAWTEAQLVEQLSGAGFTQVRALPGLGDGPSAGIVDLYAILANKPGQAHPQ